MRTKTTKIVEKEVTVYKCDLCDFETDHNRGCCGSSPVMQCYFCGKDCCSSCRKSYWENDWEDYPDFTACANCMPKVEKCEQIARMAAGRYDIWRDIVKKIHDEFEDYAFYLEDDDE